MQLQERIVNHIKKNGPIACGTGRGTPISDILRVLRGAFAKIYGRY